MSNFIPPSAVSAATNSILRPLNDARFARQVQSQKNTKHNQDVEDIDDSGVDSINDDSPRQSPDREDTHKKKPTQDQVDIASLATNDPPSQSHAAPASPPHLDISA